MVKNFRFMFWSPNDKIVVPSLHKITILMIVVDRLIRMRFPPPTPPPHTSPFFPNFWQSSFFRFIIPLHLSAIILTVVADIS